MQWWINYNSLSDKQNYLLYNLKQHSSSKICWLRGFAGTGKTLLLVHLLEQLAVLYPQATICYITYTRSLIELVRTSPIFYASKNQITIITETRFIEEKKTYDFVLLDEVQDIKAENLFKIKKLSKKLIIAGDFNQQIYDDRVSYEELKAIINPEVYELTEIFRLTQNLYNIATSIYPEIVIVEGSSLRNTNQNSNVKLVQADKIENEHIWVWHEALKNAKPGHPSVILFPNNNLIYQFSQSVAKIYNLDNPPKPSKVNGRFNYTNFNNFWESNDIALMFLGSSYGNLISSDHKQIVYLMTYFSAKGLDFKNVFIPNLTPKLKITPGDNFDRDKLLLFVAVTRSRQNLYLSYFGNYCHPLIQSLPNIYYDKINVDDKFIESSYTSNNEEEEEVNFF